MTWSCRFHVANTVFLACKESQDNQERQLCCRCNTRLKLRDGDNDIEQKAVIMVETWLRALLQIRIVASSAESMPAPPAPTAPISGNI